jgi:hypothetical protein
MFSTGLALGEWVERERESIRKKSLQVMDCIADALDEERAIMRIPVSLLIELPSHFVPLFPFMFHRRCLFKSKTRLWQYCRFSEQLQP